LRVESLELRVESLELRVESLELRVESLEFNNLAEMFVLNLKPPPFKNGGGGTAFLP